MNTFSMIGSSKPQYAQGNNNEAHLETERIMNRNEKINVRLGQGKDNVPYAWNDSKSVDGYKLLLNPEELKWLIHYLETGVSEDLLTSPEEVEAYPETQRFDEDMFKQLLENGKSVKIVPLFRESPQYISATATYRYGKVFFRMKRTEELVEYLREKNLI